MNKKYFKEVLGNKKTLKNLGINVFIWITLSFFLVFLGEAFHRGSIENGKNFLHNQTTAQSGSHWKHSSEISDVSSCA